MITESVHISRITASDTIIHNGEEKTVCPKNIKECPILGKSLFGDSYRLGHILVTRVVYINYKSCLY